MTAFMLDTRAGTPGDSQRITRGGHDAATLDGIRDAQRRP